MLKSSIARRIYVCAFLGVLVTSLVWIGFLSRSRDPGAIGRVALMASLLASLAALGISYWLAQPVVHRIRSLQRFADAILGGSSTLQTTLLPIDELETLEALLNQVASRWSETVDRLQVESARAAAILSSMVEGVLAVD